MSKNDPIMQRMKENYEMRSRTYLTKRTPVIMRLDGKAFHTYTRGLNKPFDEGLASKVKCMVASMKLSTTMKTSQIRCGDIYFNKGLRHPAVVLSVRGGNVVGALLTSSGGDMPHILCKANSRFLTKDSYFTKTIVISSVEDAIESFMYPYSNRTHLRQVKKQLKKFLKGI